MSLLPDCMNTVEMSEKGITIPILRIDGEGRGEPLMNGETPVTITICGPDSKRYRDAKRLINERRVKTLSAGGDFDEDKAELELMAAIVMGWTGIHDGKPGAVCEPCTPEKVAIVFKEFPVVMDQVAIKFSSRRNFIKGSSPA